MSRWSTFTAFVAGLFLVATVSAVLGQDDRPGQLAIVAADGNLRLVQPDGSAISLTRDAGTSGDTLRFYQWPTWAPSGNLSFFATELTRQGARALEMWVSDGGAEPSRVASVADATFTYAYASPQRCTADAPPCAPVAALLTGSTPGGFELALIAADGAPVQTIGQGAPFYFGWSPDGAEMAWHRNDARVDVYSPGQNQIVRSLPERPGEFFAPKFSPAGDGALLFGAWDEGTQSTSLVVLRGDQRTTIASGLTHPLAFAWSPDGTRIAWSDLIGPLVVADATTGAELARTPTAGTLSFFWSPAGDRIAYTTPDSAPPGSFSAKRLATPAQQGASERLLLSLLSVADGSVQRVASFVPTSEQAYLLGFFDQFALSHRVWSPDGTRIVYAELITPSQPVVQVLDVSGAQPQTTSMGPGVLGVWSFR